MKKQAFLTVATIVLTLAAALMVHGPLQAQSSQPSGVLVLPGVASSAANCSWPAGITVQNGMALCPTAQGLYYALNGQLPFIPVAGAGTPGPTGATGATGPQGSQGPAGTNATLPTSEACSTASISSAGLTASSCTFK